MAKYKMQQTQWLWLQIFISGNREQEHFLLIFLEVNIFSSLVRYLAKQVN